MKKCLVIYSGLYNTANLCLESQKKYLFDMLDKKNIKYDIYAFIGPSISLKAPGMEYFEGKEKKLSKVFNEDITLDLITECPPHVWKLLEKSIDEEYIKQQFQKFIGNKNFKKFEFQSENVDSYYNFSNCNDTLHTSGCGPFYNQLGFFDSHFYKRSKVVQEGISNESYDFIIQLRPDFLIMKSLDDILDDVLQSDQNFAFIEERIDFFYISNEIFCKKLTKETFQSIIENEDENNTDSLKYIIKNSAWPGSGLHMQQYETELYKKLNISKKRIKVGNKLSINIL